MSDPSAKEDQMLETLFADAGDVPMPDGLLDRIVQDAAEVQPSFEPVTPDGSGIWSRISDAIGGWPSLGGLATAAIAGLYVGFANPTVLETVGVLEDVGTETVLFDDSAFFDDSLEG